MRYIFIRLNENDADVADFLERQRQRGYGSIRRAVLEALRSYAATTAVPAKQQEEPEEERLAGIHRKTLRLELEEAFRAVLPSLLLPGTYPGCKEAAESEDMANALDRLGKMFEEE